MSSIAPTRVMVSQVANQVSSHGVMSVSVPFSFQKVVTGRSGVNKVSGTLALQVRQRKQQRVGLQARSLGLREMAEEKEAAEGNWEGPKSVKHQQVE